MYDRSNSTDPRGLYTDYKDELTYQATKLSAGKKDKRGSESVLARIPDNYCL
jgi:hypothetical protein